MYRYNGEIKTNFNCPLTRDIFNNMNEQQKRFFGYPENFTLDQLIDNSPKNITKTDKSLKNITKPDKSPKNITKKITKTDKSPKNITKTNKSLKNDNKTNKSPKNITKKLMSSYELQMKAAGYHLAAANATKRESKLNKL
jgi:hypothetical protein